MRTLIVQFLPVLFSSIGMALFKIIWWAAPGNEGGRSSVLLAFVAATICALLVSVIFQKFYLSRKNALNEVLFGIASAALSYVAVILVFVCITTISASVQSGLYQADVARYHFLWLAVFGMPLAIFLGFIYGILLKITLPNGVDS